MNQLKLVWEGTSSPDDTANDSTGDPLCDAVNQVLEAHWMLGLIEDEWLQERILKDMQESARRWMYMANKRVREEIQEMSA